MVRVYGLDILTDFPFRARLQPGDGSPDLRFCAGFDLDEEARGAFTHVYSSVYRDGRGRALFELHQGDGRELLRFTDRVEFLFTEAGISYRLLDRGGLLDVEWLLLSSVLAYWLERRGTLALHGSAVLLAAGAVGFLAPSGGGKSSVAASFAFSGFPLVSDDILPIELSVEGVMIESGYPEIRLAPDVGVHFLGGEFRAERRFGPETAKRCCSLSTKGRRFAPGRWPLRALYLLDRGQTASAGVEIIPVGRGAAVIEIVKATYTPTLVEGVGLAAGRLDRIAGIVGQLPLRRLRYPSALQSTEEIVPAVVADVESLDS